MLFLTVLNGNVRFEWWIVWVYACDSIFSICFCTVIMIIWIWTASHKTLTQTKRMVNKTDFRYGWKKDGQQQQQQQNISYNKWQTKLRSETHTLCVIKVYRKRIYGHIRIWYSFIRLYTIFLRCIRVFCTANILSK